MNFVIATSSFGNLSFNLCSNFFLSAGMGYTLDLAGFPICTYKYQCNNKCTDLVINGMNKQILYIRFMNKLEY